MERGGQLEVRICCIPKKGVEKVKTSSVTRFLSPDYGSHYVTEVRLTHKLGLCSALSVVASSHGPHLLGLLLVRMFLWSWDADSKSIVFDSPAPASAFL